MFKEVTIKAGNNSDFNLGQIAESLFFYKKVNLICGPEFFKNLIQQNQIDAFLELMSTSQINVKLEDNFFGVAQNHIIHPPISLLSPKLVRGSNVSIEDRLLRVLKSTTNRPGYSKRITKKVINSSEIHLYEKEILKYIDEDLKDDVYLKRVISHTISNFNSEIVIAPENIDVSIKKINDGYTIRTNIDLNKINEKSDDGYGISIDSFLFNVINTRMDSSLAGQNGSDIVTNELITKILQEKVNNIINQSVISKKQINNFSEVFLNNGKNIKGVINSGERSLSEFINILNKADKFKDWLSKLEDDHNLLKEYNEAVSDKTWVDKLPGKSFRWSLFTGAGMALDFIGTGGIGTISGIALSAGDAFILDKLIKGWRPNTFINKELDHFLSD